MNKKRSLRMKLSFSIALVSLLTVALISLLSGIFINSRFTEYVAAQNELKTVELISALSRQYDDRDQSWNADFLHTIGMYALYDGYIIRVDDRSGNSVWDAQAHDMTTCAQVMEDITERMEKRYPSLQGDFISRSYPLTQDGEIVGYVEISYFGPFFLSENDFDFIEALRTILMGVSVLALLVSIGIGSMLAGRISRPILRTVKAAGKMADGNYQGRIDTETDTAEIDQLVEAINDLAESLGKQETLRRQLTADVAHELRTPLTTMSTHIEAMVEGVWEPTTERLQSFYEELERISKLVADLENLAKIESENMQMKKAQISYPELVKKTLSSLAIEIEKKNLLISEEYEAGSDTIYGDAGRLQQVLYNLLTNAIKYSDRDGRICIGSAGKGEYTRLFVKDEGRGIAKEDLPFLFERFFRADKSRNRKTGGSGIGLAVVKSIAEAHGGYVEAESKVGEGSTFSVYLPSAE